MMIMFFPTFSANEENSLSHGSEVELIFVIGMVVAECTEGALDILVVRMDDDGEGMGDVERLPEELSS